MSSLIKFVPNLSDISTYKHYIDIYFRTRSLTELFISTQNLTKQEMFKTHMPSSSTYQNRLDLDLNIDWDLRINVYLPSLNLPRQRVFEFPLHNVLETNMNFDLRPTDLNINRDHLIKAYLLTKFEASWAKGSWVIHCTRCRTLTCPLTYSYWPEYQ